MQGHEIHRGRDEEDIPGLQGPVSHGSRAGGELQDHLLAVLSARRSVRLDFAFIYCHFFNRVDEKNINDDSDSNLY